VCVCACEIEKGREGGERGGLDRAGSIHETRCTRRL
jgi:hypothetical protein